MGGRRHRLEAHQTRQRIWKMGVQGNDRKQRGPGRLMGYKDIRT